MIQVSVSNRVFTEPTELIHIYFGLTDGVAFKPFFIFWAISILFKSPRYTRFRVPIWQH